MKRKKIIKKIDESSLLEYEISGYGDDFTEDVINIFRLGMKHGEKEAWRKFAVDSIFECTCRTNDEPETNTSGGHIESPGWCWYPHKCEKEMYCKKRAIMSCCYFDKRDSQTNKSGGHKDNPEWCENKEECEHVTCYWKRNNNDGILCTFDERLK